MRVLLLKIRNLCQKALLCPSNNFQGNRLSSKVEGLYVLQNQFVRGLNFPSFPSDKCSGSLLYVHHIIQMEFYLSKTRCICSHADLGYQLGLNMGH